MEIVREPEEMVRFRGGVFVPTMGALHAGHEALIVRARGVAAGGCGVVVSIFVNPAQFNEASDFAGYPRTMERDVEMCRGLGVDVVFAPSVEGMYPEGVEAEGERGMASALPGVAVEPGLEDRWRPGHFAGVCRVCRRLFEVVGPAAAVFGEKDWQQLQVIRAMVAMDGTGVEIVGHPTVREADGLAKSSRNVRLSAAERSVAGVVARSLERARGERDPARAEEAGRALLEEAGMGVEYFAVRDAETLGEWVEGRAGRVLTAVRLGGTRLIDNMAWPGECPRSEVAQ